MALTGIRSLVDQEMVAGLLQARQPDILTAADPDQVTRFEARVRGASVSVALLVGEDLPEGLMRDLAVEAIALETASEIEYAEFPEQQSPGDLGRGFHLHKRYLELLATLQGYVESGTSTGVTGVPAPIGSFPPPAPFPEPYPYPDTTERWICNW